MNHMKIMTAGTTALLGLTAAATAGLSPSTPITLLDDGHVRDGIHADTNFGSLGHVRSKWDEADYDRHVYLKFDTGGSNYDNYSLTLTATRTRNNISDLNFNVFALSPGASGHDWSESTITWNNAPANDVNAFGGPAFTGGGLNTDFAAHVGSFNSPASWVAGQTFQAFLDDLDPYRQIDGTVTLIITSEDMISDHLPNDDAHRWASKENNDYAAPQLMGVPVPAPGVLALLGVAGLASRRRRRG